VFCLDAVLAAALAWIGVGFAGLAAPRSLRLVRS
jgi:hypothetical protein